MGKTFNAIIKAGAYTLGFPPVSRVEITDYYLFLNGFLYGNYSIPYKDIVGIKSANARLPYFMIIDIEHLIKEYPNFRLVLFKRDGAVLVDYLKNCLNKNREITIPASEQVIINNYQNSGPIPVKKVFQYLIPFVWLVMVLVDLLSGNPKDYVSKPFGALTILSFVFLILICLSLLVSYRARKLILKSGRNLKHIDRSVYALILFFFLALLGLYFFGVNI